MEIDSLIAKISPIFHDEWRYPVNCWGQDPSIFFNEDTVEQARRVCRGCCVKTECLDDAMYNEDEGVRGATTQDERISVILYRRRHNATFQYDMEKVNVCG